VIERENDRVGGLAGEAIPLAARVFAMIDVGDGAARG